MAENKGSLLTSKSFDEVYKTSYSHGLESIYRLENVDVNTIRKWGGEEDQPLTPEAPILSDEGDEELDLGSFCSGYLTSFVLEEPIQVLKLSRHIEKNLIEQGLLTLGALSQTDFNALAFVKGMGQGHIVELKEKLQERIGEAGAIKPRRIDIYSWVRALAGEIEPKMAWAALEPFGLHEAIPLTPLESVEIKKLTQERKNDCIDQAAFKLKSPYKVKCVRDRLQEIEAVFLRPWISVRGGVARETEIEERLKRVATLPDKVEGMIRFLKEYFIGASLFHLPGKNGLIFATPEEWGEFSLLENRVLEYLWNEDARVPYPELVRWLSRDLAMTWQALPEKLLRKVLAFSPLISREKGDKGVVLIKRTLQITRNV